MRKIEERGGIPKRKSCCSMEVAEGICGGRKKVRASEGEEGKELPFLRKACPLLSITEGGMNVKMGVGG